MPRNKHPEETVQKIFDVSLRLFLEKGYEQTTILDIVNNLGGLTRGAFYHHFKSKEDVLNALLEMLYEDDAPFQTIRDMKGVTGLEKVQALFASSPERVKYPELVRAAMSLLQHPRFLAEHLKRSQKAARTFEPMIQEGMADGSIRPGNAKLLADLCMVLFKVWLIPAIFPCDKTELVDKIMLIKQIFEGLGFPVMDEQFMKNSGIFAEMLKADSSPS